jgi:hypothetical protein
MNTIELFTALLDYARDVNGSRPSLPPALAERSFTWAGGGQGPEPPIDDA